VRTLRRASRTTSPQWWGLAPRFVLVVSLAALLAGGCIGLLAAQSSRDALRAQIFTSQLAAADLAAQFVSQHVQAAERATRLEAAAEATLRAVVDDTPERLQPRLAQVLAETPQLESIGIVDITGRIRTTAVPGSQNGGASATDRDWFQQVIATGQPSLGAPDVSRLTGDPVVLYAVPILDESATVRGVLVGAISLATLSETMSHIQTGATARTGLNDLERGIILAHVDPARILQPFSGRNPAISRSMTGERGSMEVTNSAGELDLTAFAPVPGLAWGIFIQEPSAVAFAPVTTLTQRILLLMGAAILAAVALGAGMALHVIRPLRRLRTAAHEVAAGDLSIRVDIRQRSELGELGSAFNQMAIQLQEIALARARAEQATQEHAARLQALVESLDDILFEFDAQGVYLHTWTNDDSLLAQPSAELLGRTVTDVLGEAVGRPFLAQIQRVIARRQPESMEYALQVQGGLRWFLARTSPVRAADGSCVSACMLSQDITERKAAEQEHALLMQTEFQLQGVQLAARELAHLLNNALAMPVAALELLAAQSTVPAHLREVVRGGAEGLAEARAHIQQLQRVTRIEVKETIVGPALDLERSVRRAASESVTCLGDG
jgi:PAS domain S-box-containing protein